MTPVPTYSILCYAFWFSFWIPVDWVFPLYHAWVFFLLALYQRIYLLAEGAIPDPQEFWFWQFIVTLLGVLIGVAVQWITSPPPLLSTRHRWEKVVFIKAPVLSLAYIASQIFYWNLPIPDSPWGIVLSILLTSVVIGVAWRWNLDQPWRVGDPVNTYVFWLWVLAVNLLLQVFHFILYTGLEAKYVGLIAGGATLLLVILSQVLIVFWWNRDGRMGIPMWRRFSRTSVPEPVIYTKQTHQQHTEVLLRRSRGEDPIRYNE